MSENKDAEMKKQEREQIVELGSDITKSSKGSIYTLTIIGQVEGHMIAPETVKPPNMSMFCRCWPESRKATTWTVCCCF